MPSSLQAQMTRSAISPRLATRIFWNMAGRRLPLPAGTDAVKRLPVFHGLSVFDKDANQFAAFVRLDFVHQLHGFDDTERLPGFDMRPDLHKGLCTRTWSLVIRPY